jgi:glycosyltransferase involved in cell wall biosynthesis
MPDAINQYGKDGMNMDCSVVIPVYFGEPTLEELIIQLEQVLPSLFSNYEIILVNDGSRDASWEIISSLAKSHSRIRAFNLMRNYGQHNALLCGIRAAQYPITVTMDDDLQHPPQEIGKMINRLEDGFDVVYGTPRQEKHTIWRKLASQVTKLILQSTMGAETARQVSAFRVFRTNIRKAFADYNNPYVSIDVLLTWGASRFASIPVQHNPRHSGQSNYTLRQLSQHALNLVTGFSIIPLQIASMAGFMFALFGAVVLIYVIGRYLIQGGSVPGFPFLASIIAIFSGVQLFALGIIGEYIARMHFRLMDRPAYVVGEAAADMDTVNSQL